MSLHHDHYTCLLCRISGEQLVGPGCAASLFLMHEHLVEDHRVAWPVVLLAGPQALPAEGGPGQVVEWSLPEGLARELDWPQPRYLRVTRARAGSPATSRFYLAADFPAHALCALAEREIIDALEASPDAASLCGGVGEMGERPIVVFIAREPGREPPLDVQGSLWAAIHRHQGSCFALPGEALENLLLFARRETLIARAMNPGRRWAEVYYDGGVPIQAAEPGDGAPGEEGT